MPESRLQGRTDSTHPCELDAGNPCRHDDYLCNGYFDTTPKGVKVSDPCPIHARLIDDNSSFVDHWGILIMPRKVRELIQDLTDAGFYGIAGGGKGSHRKFTHARYARVVTLSGKLGDDVKSYQERQVKRAIEEVQK
jgi:predicted RNA binding protein YcfA (HicA-like mRNA interferase family)